MPEVEITSTTAGNNMYTLLSTHGTYSTARAGNGTRTQWPYPVIGTDYFQNEFDCYQAFLQFNTSAIPADAVITSAVLSLYINDNFSTAPMTARVRRNDSWTYNLQNSHFVPGANLTGLAIGGELPLGPSSSGWIDISLSSAAINKAGTTRLLLYEALQESSSAFPTSEERYISTIPPGGATGFHPRLVINYEEGTSELPAPANFTFQQVAGQRTVEGNWDAVSGTTNYDWEVQVRSGNSWAAHWSNWTVNTFFELTNANGNIQWNTRYRARVKASPPSPEIGAWSNWVELTTSLEPGAQDLQIFRFVGGSLIPVDIFRGASGYSWAIGQAITTPGAP